VTSLEEQVRRRGFASTEEYYRLIATANFPTREQIERFKEWHKRNGTKAELERIAQGEK
jgi:hypothetical protein